ncbi:hypothetical protein CR513_52828, partial [Mucuna pruriens]
MAENLVLEPCSVDERVYHSTGEGERDFVYLYETMIKDLGVFVPFDKYEADILRFLGTFRVMCHCLHIKPTSSLFLCHYTRIGMNVDWVSLSPFPKTNLFTTYSAFYKEFKNRFIKVWALNGVFFANDKKPMSLYGRCPQKFKGHPRSALSLEEKLHLSFLNELLRGMNCKNLVALAFESKPITLFRISQPRANCFDFHFSLFATLIMKHNFDFNELRHKALAAQKTLKESTPPPQESNPVAKIERVPEVEEPTSTPSELILLQAESKSMQIESSSTEKRKAVSIVEEEDRKKKGKGVADSSEDKTTRTQSTNASPPPIEGGSEVRTLPAPKNLLLVPEFPLGGLAHWNAPFRCRSMWSTNFRPHSLIGPNFLSPFDRVAML